MLYCIYCTLDHWIYAISANPKERKYSREGGGRLGGGVGGGELVTGVGGRMQVSEIFS